MSSDYAVARCHHDGMTIVRLPPIDPREPGDHDARLAFKRNRMRKWLRETQGARRNVLRFGSAAR